MALTDGNENGGMVMPVSPMGGFGNGGYGFGNEGWWIILLLVLLGNNGWGNGFGGGFGGGGAGYVDASVQRGFDQNAIMSALGDIQGAICNGFAGVESSANARQIADMQNFALQSQFAECCCENRLASADLKYTIATENCADRYEAAQNTRDIIENDNRNNQAILDKLCALELDAKNTKIADLERQLTMANLAASQTAQTSRLLADNTAQTIALEQYLNPTPVPAYVVQNPNCCNNNYGTNCGCGSF